jgi:hypothetical protein
MQTSCLVVVSEGRVDIWPVHLVRLVLQIGGDVFDSTIRLEPYLMPKPLPRSRLDAISWSTSRPATRLLYLKYVFTLIEVKYFCARFPDLEVKIEPRRDRVEWHARYTDIYNLNRQKYTAYSSLTLRKFLSASEP